MILGIDASQANRKTRSGTEWYAWHIIQQFKKLLGDRKDLRVRLYIRDSLRSDLANNLPVNFEVRVLKWRLRYFWGQVRLSIEMLLHPPDILFCPAHTLPFICPKTGSTSPPVVEPVQFTTGQALVPPHAWGGKLGKGKTFTTLHDVGFEDYPELYDKLSLWYHKWAARKAVRNSTHIFTVSKFSKERIIENLDCAPDRISVTYLGIDKNYTIDKLLSSLEKYGLVNGEYLLFMGRLEPKKNIVNMVKAYEIAGVQEPLVLAGQKIYTTELDDYLEKKPGLKAKIRFLGYIEEDDKRALYVGATMFLFPTLYEGFGLPILEAQAAGTPVITSNTASNPEIAGEGAMLVNPDSPHEIAEAIVKLMNENDLREEKIRLGYENVKRFRWEETARATWKILSK